MSVVSFMTPLSEDELDEFFDSMPDIGGMDVPTLNLYRDKTQRLIDRMDAFEPKNRRCEEYDLWAEMHEDLEDTLDEILDCLDEQ